MEKVVTHTPFSSSSLFNCSISRTVFMFKPQGLLYHKGMQYNLRMSLLNVNSYSVVKENLTEAGKGGACSRAPLHILANYP